MNKWLIFAVLIALGYFIGTRYPAFWTRFMG